MHAGLDLDQILAAASTLDPASVTMRAVAGILGVDHKALNHHVADHDTLMGLLAWRAFSVHFSSTTARHDDWRDTCRQYAAAVAAAAAAVGPLVGHLNLQGASLTGFVVKVEELVATIVRAGFTDEQALRFTVALSNLCIAHARDLHTVAAFADGPRREVVRRALAASPDGTLPNLSRILDEHIDTYSSEQLTFAVELLLRGLEASAGRRSSTFGH